MEIEEIKSISLVSYLAAHNYVLKKAYHDKYWYLSPLHEEKNASFKVNLNTNLWYDFGLNKGGNIINLVKELHPSLSMHEVLKLLENEIRQYGLNYEKALTNHLNTTIRNYNKRHTVVDQDDTEVTQLMNLSNYNLKRYLQQRRIDLEVAQRYCKEVHYRLKHNNKQYYGVAFMNIECGMEVRNKFFKRCIGKKTFSYVVENSQAISNRCCVFEGFFDFLTYMTLKRINNLALCIDGNTDYIILNSVSNVRRSFEILEDYEFIHCYLDNDRAGRDATESIKRKFKHRVYDESYRYRGYNDLNDVILGLPSKQ